MGRLSSVFPESRHPSKLTIAECWTGPFSWIAMACSGAMSCEATVFTGRPIIVRGTVANSTTADQISDCIGASVFAMSLLMDREYMKAGSGKFWRKRDKTLRSGIWQRTTQWRWRRRENLNSPGCSELFRLKSEGYLFQPARTLSLMDCGRLT